jgi:hypothetical protein
MLDLILDVTPEEMDAANDAANAEYYDSVVDFSAPEGMEDDWLPSPPDEIWVVGKVVKDV